MRWASAQSSFTHAGKAARDVAAQLREALGEGPVDLALAFFTAHHVPSARDLGLALVEALAPRCLMGTSAHGVISREHETENGCALSVIGARLPGVELSPFIVMNEIWQEIAADGSAFAQAGLGVSG